MKTSSLIMNFSIDKENRKIKVEREFQAPVSNVWSAWTNSNLLDQWWAPKPWQAKTKMMDFKEGGYWLYAMVGPNGEEQWCRADYVSISPLNSFIGKDAFCDVNGMVNQDFPVVTWMVKFIKKTDTTLLNIEISFDQYADLEKYIEMGFREGFTAALENLDALLES